MCKSAKKALIFSFIVFAVFLCSVYMVYAAPYNGKVFKFEQPDHSVVEAKVYGDEFYQRVESIDGYPLAIDPETKWICYAVLNSDESDFVSTGIKYKGTIVENDDNLKSMLKNAKVEKGKK